MWVTAVCCPSVTVVDPSDAECGKRSFAADMTSIQIEALLIFAYMNFLLCGRASETWWRTALWALFLVFVLWYYEYHKDFMNNIKKLGSG